MKKIQKRQIRKMIKKTRLYKKIRRIQMFKFVRKALRMLLTLASAVAAVGAALYVFSGKKERIDGFIRLLNKYQDGQA